MLTHTLAQADTGMRETKSSCLLTGDLHGASDGGEKAKDPFFSSLNENGRNVSLPTAPHGIIKDGDAKDSLIRFFNY